MTNARRVQHARVEELERALALISTACLGIVDNSGELLSWNNAAEFATNVPRELAVGKSIAQLFVLNDLDWAKVSRTGQTFEIRLQHETNCPKQDFAATLREIDESIFLFEFSPNPQREPSLLQPSKPNTLLNEAVTGDLERDKFHSRTEIAETLELAKFSIDQAVESIFWIEPDGTIAYANESAAKTLGYAQSELIGLTVPEIDPNFPADAWPSHWEEVKARKSFTFESDHVTRHRGVIRTEVTVNYLVFNGREYNCAIMRDISERHRIAEALRESDKHLRQLADAIPQMVWIASPDGALVYLNSKAYEYTGVPSGQLEGWSWGDVIHPDDLNQLLFFWSEAIRSEVPLDIEFRIRRFDGSYRWHIGRQYPSRDASGRVVTWYGTCTDIQDLKQSTQAILDREKLLRIVTDSAEVGLFVINTDFEFLFMNDACGSLLELEPQFAVGQSAISLIGNEYDEFLGVLELAFSGWSPRHEFAFRSQVTPEKVTWIRAKCTPSIDKDNNLTVVAVLSDISADRHQEEAMRSSEERYRRLVDVLPDAVLIVSRGRITFFNPTCTKLLQADSTNRLLGSDPLELFHPDQRELVRYRINKVTSTGEPSAWPEELTVVSKQKEIPVHVVATPISQNDSTTVLLCLHDLTERERTTKVLKSVLYSVRDAIMTVDEQGRVLMSNPAAESLFRYQNRNLVGLDASTLFVNLDTVTSGSLRALLSLETQHATSRSWTELVGNRSDGTKFPVELTVTKFISEGQLRFTLVARDISTRKQLEEQFRQSQKLEAIGRLAGGIAHDFNNLLTVINGYSDLLLFGMRSESEFFEPLQAIRAAGDRAARLTGQLLAFGRRSLVEPQLVSLNHLIDDSVTLLRRLIGENVNLVLNLSKTPVYINADLGQLEQIIMNLVVNARDAMPQGGTIAIETDQIGIKESRNGILNRNSTRFAVLSVTDDGIGMPETIRQKIFEPFFSTKEFGKGTGLGLAVVHGIVEQCGGFIEVDSYEGTGTSFRLFFPASDSTTPEQSLDTIDETRGTETILVVEDEEVVRRIIRLTLESKGYNLLVASTPIEALEILKMHVGKLDMLISDLVLPQMNGRELSELVREVIPNLPVLFISGYTDDASIRTGIELSLHHFLGKPFGPLELSRKVRSVLNEIHRS